MFFEKEDLSIMGLYAWEKLKCFDCGGHMIIYEDNDYESIKECLDCCRKDILIKQLRSV